jgi:CHAT domain-containing protein
MVRAFFCAGARSFIVSKWEVNSDSAAALSRHLRSACRRSNALACRGLRQSVLAMIGQCRERADPK